MILVTKSFPSSKPQGTSSLHCFGSNLVSKSEMKMKPLILKGFFEKSICKLVQDECYSDVFLFQGSIKRRIPTNGVFLINPYFPEAWAGIAALTITDSFSFRLRKLVYCKH